MNFIKLTIFLSVLFFGVFALAYKAEAVTEFKVTVKPSGGDYTSLSAAEDGLDYTGACDLTSGNYKTAEYDGVVGEVHP